MKIFRINSSMDGETFVVRPLLNARDIKNSILSYKIGYVLNPQTLQYDWKYRYLCFALINDELEIFNYSESMSKYITSDTLKMNSSKSIVIDVHVKEGLLSNKYNIVINDKYRFDNTPQKREYIKGVLTNTTLDLNDALKQEKNRIKDMVIDIPDPNDFSKTIKKKLSEIYDNESNYEL